MIKYIGFDKDGTLFDSMREYANIWGDIFHENYGIDAQKAGNFLIDNAGQPTSIQVFNLLKQNNILVSEKEAFDKSVEIAEKLGRDAKSKPFPEVPELLKKLKEDSYKIFVSSGQQEDVIKKDLEESDLMQYIDFYAGIRPEQPDYMKGRAHFKAAAKYFNIPFEMFIKEVVFIGDTLTDLEVATNENIPCIIRKNSNSYIEGAKYYVDNFKNLLDLIKQI